MILFVHFIPVTNTVGETTSTQETKDTLKLRAGESGKDKKSVYTGGIGYICAVKAIGYIDSSLDIETS